MSDTKVCTKCGECKLATAEFFHKDAQSKDKLVSRCKPCNSKAARTWQKSNKDRVAEGKKKYAVSNKEKISTLKKSWSLKNKDHVKHRNKEYQKNRKLTDPVFKMRGICTNIIYLAMKSKGLSKSLKTIKIIGCDWDFLKSHIERQFANGMNWDNRGQWHIDHIVPMASAKTEADVIALNHFTNLRPMWAADNLAKSDTITHLI